MNQPCCGVGSERIGSPPHREMYWPPSPRSASTKSLSVIVRPPNSTVSCSRSVGSCFTMFGGHSTMPIRSPSPAENIPRSKRSLTPHLRTSVCAVTPPSLSAERLNAKNGVGALAAAGAGRAVAWLNATTGSPVLRWSLSCNGWRRWSRCSLPSSENIGAVSNARAKRETATARSFT